MKQLILLKKVERDEKAVGCGGLAVDSVLIGSSLFSFLVLVCALATPFCLG
jgi:hypothetical protein